LAGCFGRHLGRAFRVAEAKREFTFMNASSRITPLLKQHGIAFGVLLFLLIGIPLLSALSPSFQLGIWGKYLCYASLAVSLNWLWGYTGLLCLCQSLFFALGGYMMGMHLMLLIGKLGSYQSDLPDFMVFLGYQELPSFWQPFYSFIFSSGMVLILPGLVAFIFGWLAFRSRIKGVYFSILSQALTYAATLLFFRNDLGMGGNNGFTDFRFILGMDIRTRSTQILLYEGSVLFLAACIGFIAWITKTKFGMIQQAVRDSENRVLFSGYATTSYKLFVFTVSAIMAGIAGAFYVPQVGIINPGEMETSKSLDVVVWVAVGGRGTLYGPVMGAILVNLLKSYTTRYYPDYWLIISGAIFIFVVLFMPNGVVGLPKQLSALWAKLNKFRASKSALIAPSP
jgi:urea transport system permease protein